MYVRVVWLMLGSNIIRIATEGVYSISPCDFHVLSKFLARYQQTKKMSCSHTADALHIPKIIIYPAEQLSS